MSTLSLRVKYRPIRIGWCVREGNWDDIRRVLRLSHTLWGGRYNPLIPIDDIAFAKSLIEVFRVDALCPASNDDCLRDFAKSFTHLPWPLFHAELFIEGSRGKMPTLLDIYHPVRHLYEEHVKNLPSPKISAVLLDWDPADPLGDVFLATFGLYPSTDETGRDYSRLVHRYLSGQRIHIPLDQPLNPDVYKLLTPASLTEYRLARYRSLRSDYPGLYVGSASDFTDIVNFWNLRAADIDLIFFDPANGERLRPLADAYLAELRKRLPPQPSWFDKIGVWSKSREDDVNPSQFGPETIRCVATATTWNGLNVKPPLMHFGERSVLGSVDASDSPPTVTFQLPDKPFFDELEFHTQHAVVSVHPLVDITKGEEWTWQTLFIPELNEFYGRDHYLIWNQARAEVDGLGIISEITRDHLTLWAVSRQALVGKIFEVFGMKAVPSQPGLIGTRLIRQMGGLQGCRVFKIPGVRKLIEKYKPSQSFTRSGAVQIIGQNDPATGRPNFEPYESLFIEPRTASKLKPEDAFTYLVKKGVFRVGLEFSCPSCNLGFWLSLDAIATEVVCEYCGKGFNVTPQLRDRDWAYRRSGLFGREDHQEGGIPVALTLQQLDTMLGLRSMVYTTGLLLTPLSACINTCEMDLTLFTQGYEERLQLAIGEYKTSREISEEDVENMRKVADALPRERFDVFIIFSKTSEFTPQEIARCRLAQGPYGYRVILLSQRELEPYFIYERTEKEFEIRRSAISLEDLANATHNIYFEPKRKVTL